MSRKRRNTSSEEPEEIRPSVKRQRPSWVESLDTLEYPTGSKTPRIDAWCGQQEAFPGLENDEDELIYGDPEDGIQYLRMVRAERKSYPSVLAATKGVHLSAEDHGWEEDGYDGQEDFHPDRAWIAAPDQTTKDGSDAAHVVQDLCRRALLDRFARLQMRLQINPPLTAIELLKSSCPISFPPDAPQAQDKWRSVTKTMDPSPTQLACMDHESITELVKLLTVGMSETIKSRSAVKIKRLGAWIWATLGRCRDRGELSSEEIAELRLMGKRAGQLMDFAKRNQPVKLEYRPDNRVLNDLDLDQGAADIEEIEDNSELEQKRADLARLLNATEEEESPEAVDESTSKESRISGAIDSDKQIRMVLDTTLTLIGEVYGQRDLLELRDIWD